MTCCVTGHRPAGFPFPYRTDGEKYRLYRKRLFDVISAIVEENDTCHFISGFALGADLDFAETVLTVKGLLTPAKAATVTLEAAIPCPDQTARWHAADVHRYEALLERCNRRTLISPCYYDGCMQVRNRYMVDNSDAVLAIWNRVRHGGTWNTIDYAHKARKTLFFMMLDEI